MVDTANHPFLADRLHEAGLRWVHETAVTMAENGLAYQRRLAGDAPPLGELRPSTLDAEDARNGLALHGGLSFIIEAGVKRRAPDPGADLGARVRAYLHLLRWLLAADEQRRVDLAAAYAARAIPLPPWLATTTFWANTAVRVTHVPVIELATARTIWVASAGVMHDRVVKTAQPTPWGYAVELTAAQAFRPVLESHGVTFDSPSSARAAIASPCRLLRVEDEYDEVYHRYEGCPIVTCSTPGRRSLPPGTLLVPHGSECYTHRRRPAGTHAAVRPLPVPGVSHLGERGWRSAGLPGHGAGAGAVKAAIVARPGDEEVLPLIELPLPVAGPGEARIRVVATALNRADLLQRQGRYPPPPGASEVLGLECAGEIVEVGKGVSPSRIGERVMALLAGGGYAEEAVAPAGCPLALPSSLSWEEAAALPEAALTVFLTVFRIARLRPGESLLVHGGASGIGTTALAMVREPGGDTLVTVGSPEKCRRCMGLGAREAICYRQEDFAERARKVTGGAGVNVVLDAVGAPSLTRNLAVLAEGGRLVLIGTMGGSEAPIDLRTVMRKRLSVFGSTLRARPAAEKEALAAAFWDAFGEAVAAGRVRPVIDSVYPLAQAAEAHRRMAASAHTGKIVLRVRA